jgi:chloride channel protein, CIC family
VPAPLLIMGGALGSCLGVVLPDNGIGFWALLGMAAMMGGTMRAPLTAAFFAVELTGAFSSILPLFVACTSAYTVTVLVMKRSILTEKLARRGHHIVREYHADPFALVAVRNVMVKAVDTLASDMPVADAVAFFTGSETRHKAYPVLDPQGRLAGMMSRADALRWLREPPNGTLGAILDKQTVVVAYPEEPVGHVADRMVAESTGRIPIVTPEDNHLVGLVTRKDLLHVRQLVASEELIRERA